jgi:hypothetical protein|tara:strand:+ start:249 stop:503 length:255 start_codon:yes stop_codon:yes gene_type:complete
MKLFIYKTLFAAIIFFVLFQITISATVNKFKENISYLSSDENKNLIKNKLRKELNSAIKKENYLNEEDKKLIKQFLDKVKKELE